MKTKHIFSTLFVGIAIVFVSFNSYQSAIIGPHDGIVKEAGDYNIEIKNSEPTLYAYLLDKKLKPIANKGILCEARFLFSDSTNVNIHLKPYGNEGFSMESSALKYNSYRIYFNVNGKMVSAQFENESLIVEKK
jgi:hypothetical protein